MRVKEDEKIEKRGSKREWKRERERERERDCFVLFSWEFVDPNNSVWVKNQVSIRTRKTGFLESRLSVGKSSSTPKEREQIISNSYFGVIFKIMSDYW